ncbi:MAG TPA: TlpA disulfide reductase family protein [Anaeromyxobacter sp.]|nr:TlpA disulfide reductase family protein [Anaeromyxobacter sp.]
MRLLVPLLLLAFAASAAAADDGVAVGKPAPPFALRVLNPEVARAEIVSLDLYAGEEPEDPASKAVLISFFASWCEPCRKELPLLVQLDRMYREQGLRVLSIDIEDDAPGVEATLRMVEKAKVAFPVLSDRFTLVARRYLGPKGQLPAVFLVRRDGTIAKIERGYAKEASRSLVADVRAALGIAPERKGKAGAPAP